MVKILKLNLQERIFFSAARNIVEDETDQLIQPQIQLENTTNCIVNNVIKNINEILNCLTVTQYFPSYIVRNVHT